MLQLANQNYMITEWNWSQWISSRQNG